ncbi:hypothetical protein Tco_0185355 [Tanacetum coccineum]
MIGSLMYLTASRPDIMFAVCACSRFQVTPKSSHLSAVKRIFRYLKGKPKLGLWYPYSVHLLTLESYSDSDYAGANLDRNPTGVVNSCKRTQFLVMQKADHMWLLLLQKQNMCCCRLLWALLCGIQNQTRIDKKEPLKETKGAQRVCKSKQEEVFAKGESSVQDGSLYLMRFLKIHDHLGHKNA